MPSSFRSENLFLARFVKGSERDILQALGGSVPQATLQKQVKGERKITDREAGLYAEAIGLPTDWFDRNNAALLQLSGPDYRLISAILQLDESKRAALTKLLE